MMEPTGPRAKRERDHQLSIWASARHDGTSSSSLEHTSLRMEKEDLAVLREMAEANHLSLATLIRNIVHAWIVEEAHRDGRPAMSETGLAERIASMVADRLRRDFSNPPRS